MNDIRRNVKLTGRITNVTTFGAFVDIGVGRDRLIRVSKMLPGAFEVLGVGDIVEVIVDQFKVNKRKINKGKIGLRMLSTADRNVLLCA